MPPSPFRCKGVTLVEMMVGLAILAVLLAIGVPSFSRILQNGKLHAAAESLMAGLQSARSEAIRRNMSTQFLLTGDSLDQANYGTTNYSFSGPTWMVRVPNLDTNCAAYSAGQYCFVEGKSGSEGSGRAAGSAPLETITGTAAVVVFDGFGKATFLDNSGSVSGTSATFSYQNPTAGNCAPNGPVRCLNVTVSSAGQVRMCDPAATASGDTRGC